MQKEVIVTLIHTDAVVGTCPRCDGPRTYNDIGTIDGELCCSDCMRDEYIDDVEYLQSYVSILKWT